MKKTIFCKINIDGLHNWSTFPDDNSTLKEVSYLKNEHRHRWYFVCYKEVKHNDRDTEFIWLQHEIEQYLRNEYWNDRRRTHVFGSRSCEMLGEELLRKFDLDKVVVSEDNENGAIVERVTK
jgi:hypothetical protein